MSPRPPAGHPTETASAWRALEIEARADALRGLESEETTALQAGALVAWSTHRFGGTTDGFSPVHRVGESGVTLCGAPIPEAIKRVRLSGQIVRSLGRCKYCEAKYSKQEQAA